MLQQTQVDRVVEYWERFLSRFPDAETCAEAEVDDVVALWSGLGYYRRARQLHAAVRQVVSSGAPQHWPRTVEEWKALPGVGRYTAAALASQLWGERVAAIDGNVERVLGRVLGLAGRYGASERRQIAVLADTLVDCLRPGDMNQALMEVGALVCRPRAPRCGACPLEVTCEAAATGEPEQLGPTKRTLRKVDLELVVAVVEQGDLVGFVRRSERERLLGGLWELPWASADGVEGLSERYGGSWVLSEPLGRVGHSITFRRIEALVVQASWSAPAEGVEWVDPALVGQWPTSSLFLKCLDVVVRARQNRAPSAVSPRSSGGGAATEHEPADDLVVRLAQSLGDEMGE